MKFEKILSIVKKVSHDSDKLGALKELISELSEFPSSDQLVQLFTLLSFDDSRVNALKTILTRCSVLTSNVTSSGISLVSLLRCCSHGSSRVSALSLLLKHQTINSDTQSSEGKDEKRSSSSTRINSFPSISLVSPSGLVVLLGQGVHDSEKSQILEMMIGYEKVLPFISTNELSLVLKQFAHISSKKETLERLLSSKTTVALVPLSIFSEQKNFQTFANELEQSGAISGPHELVKWIKSFHHSEEELKVLENLFSFYDKELKDWQQKGKEQKEREEKQLVVESKSSRSTWSINYTGTIAYATEFASSPESEFVTIKFSSVNGLDNINDNYNGEDNIIIVEKKRKQPSGFTMFLCSGKMVYNNLSVTGKRVLGSMNNCVTNGQVMETNINDGLTSDGRIKIAKLTVRF
jgi:hypothetical protein